MKTCSTFTLIFESDSVVEPEVGIGVSHDFSLIILAEKSCGHRPEFGPSSARAKFRKEHGRERCAVENRFGITKKEFCQRGIFAR